MFCYDEEDFAENDGEVGDKASQSELNMSPWSKPEIVENGVEVYWSADCEVYRLTNSETGEYDAKIDVYPDHVETYMSEDSYWDEHDHYHTDSNGVTNEAHPMEARKWKTTYKS